MHFRKRGDSNRGVHKRVQICVFCALLWKPLEDQSFILSRQEPGTEVSRVCIQGKTGILGQTVECFRVNFPMERATTYLKNEGSDPALRKQLSNHVVFHQN